ncbi:hypothetical protein [Prosthecobacter sp.]|uniref:hypothetical protein n=1 Tax=Prosthecobacter sp. TaxID=1965333 RepID=UPI001D3434CA|nr:hypothetical protein [Prosthecobacter sp.]MCB1277477.1 hypothetical protein [Prosthecobacter sp.]
MRWPVLLLLLMTAALGAGSEIVEIPCTTWFEGGITTTDVIVIAEVVQTESEVVPLNGQMLLKEACLVRIDKVIGNCPKLQRAKAVLLKREYPHDPYEQIDPDWGRYRHLRPGWKTVLLVHYYENDLAVGSDAVIGLTNDTQSLPEILRRAGLNFSLYTDEDLVVWKAASPRMYPDLVARVAYERELLEKARSMTGLSWGERLLLGCVVPGLIFVVSRLLIRIKRS